MSPAKRTARGGAKQREEEAAPLPELDAAELEVSSDEEYESGDEEDDSELGEEELAAADVSGSDSEDDEQRAGGGKAAAARGVDREIENAVLGYMAAAEKRRRQRQQRRRGGSRCEGEAGVGASSWCLFLPCIDAAQACFSLYARGCDRCSSC